MFSVETVNTFKNNEDNFWSNQDALYEYKAGLGVVNCSYIR